MGKTVIVHDTKTFKELGRDDFGIILGTRRPRHDAIRQITKFEVLHCNVHCIRAFEPSMKTNKKFLVLIEYSQALYSSLDS